MGLAPQPSSATDLAGLAGHQRPDPSWFNYRAFYRSEL